MTEESQKPPFGSTAAKWLGLQIAGKALGFALGTPFVMGALMGFFAYLSDLPLAWGFFAVVVVTASTAVALNQGRTFLVSYSTAGKLHFVGASVLAGRNQDGRDGYLVSLLPRNGSDVSLEYQITRITADLGSGPVKSLALAAIS